MEELTEKEINNYKNDVSIKLEDQLDDCRIRRWEVIFDEDYLTVDTQKPAFILHDEKYPLGDIDMNGNMKLDNDSDFKHKDVERFSPEELMILGAFGKKLKYGRL